MTNITFLKALLDKLRGGNSRSIHLNALPGRSATRLDFAQLNYIKPGVAEAFLNTLLTESSFEFNISFDGIDLFNSSDAEQRKLGLLSKRLNAINIENEDNYKEFGVKTFGFGFPILIKPTKQDPKKFIKAPVFIWELDIISSPNKANSWRIVRNKSLNEKGKLVNDDIHSITLNEVLLSFLQTDADVKIPKLSNELLEDSVISKSELIEECHKILTLLNAKQKDTIKSDLYVKSIAIFEELRDKEDLEKWQPQPNIYFGGVFGLYRSQKESIISDLENIIDNIHQFEFENLKIENFNGTPHSAIETDPSQQRILNTLGIEPKKIIQGPPGTGKSQTLTAIITNALANNLKCLVVCEKKTALDVIKDNLNKESEYLGALVAVIEDLNKDRNPIVNSVRDRLDNVSFSGYFNKVKYDNLIAQIESLVNKVNDESSKLGEKIYQGKKWTEIVGEFLKRKRDAGFDGLMDKLDYEKFKLSKDDKELDEIILKIRRAKKLFSNVNLNDNPFEILDDSMFIYQDYFPIHQKVKKITANSKDLIEKINTELKSQIEEYESWLESHFTEYYSCIQNLIKSCQVQVNLNYKKFGESFYKNDGFSNFKLSVLRLFSDKYKSLSIEKENLLIKFNEIKETQLKNRYFEHEYTDTANLYNLKEIIENIDSLNAKMQNWFAEKETLQLYLNKFSSVGLHPLFADKHKVQEIERKIEEFLSFINKEKIIKKYIDTPKTHKQKIYTLEQLNNNIDTIDSNLDDFREYFEWYKFYLESSKLEQSVIDALLDVELITWEESFVSWYYYWLLGIAETQLKTLPKDDVSIGELFETKRDLKKSQIASIVDSWGNRQKDALNEADKKGISPISLYNKRGSRGQTRNSLRKIISSDFHLFTNFFPVVMVNPTVCSSIMPLKEGLFDIVIFDEASQLRIEDTFSSLTRGKIKIIAGDSQQMPPTNYFQGGINLINATDEDEENEEDDDGKSKLPTNATKNRNSDYALDLADSESLLDYATNCNYKSQYLEIHYRSQHPYLIDFSNHAFYGKRLKPMPEKEAYIPIRYIEVNGLYEDRTNKDEAKRVVEILINEVKRLKNGKYPSIGIATFNIEQRNLILEEITKARQQYSEFDIKMGELQSNPETSLFVKNLENIQGDERDLIIISTTFGKKADGKFRQSFGPILQRNGYKLLNVIVTRAKLKIIVCTSIPNEHINQYPELLKEQKNNGRAIFYAYLAYAKYISEGNNEMREKLLKMLLDNCESKNVEIANDVYGSESPFEEEVYYRLAGKIGQERLQQQYKVAGFRIDLIVKPKVSGKPIIAIECDGAKYHSSTEAYAWDMFRQSMLEKQGFVFYRIWSTNWWHSEEKELKKLVEFVIRQDNS